MNNKGAVRPFGWRDKIGYMVGNVGNDFTFIFASLFLQVFYTDVLGISAALVGTMFMMARVVDAFTDTIMGRIADKARAGRAGKFKPWLLRFCGPVALTSFLMYQSAMAGAQMWLKIVYMFVTYLLWGSICYTAINIPYGSMASVLSGEADDRSALSTARGLGSMLPQIAVGVIMPIFLYTTLSDGRRVVNANAFPIAALIFSAAALVCYIVCYFMCTERVVHEGGSRHTAIGESLKMLFSSRSLIAICIVYICFLGSQMLSQTISNYVFKDYFSNTLGLTVMNAVGFVPVLLLAPLAVPLSRKFGKREVGAFVSFIGAAAFLLLFLLRTANMWIFVVISVIGLMGFGLFNLIIWAFISDVIDDNEVQTGVRQDGTIYAVCSFSRKLGQAIASGLGGWSLALIGYAEGSLVGQSQAVKDGIYNIATFVPTVLYFTVGMLLVLFYPLGKRRVRENTRILKERKADNAQGGTT